MSDTNPEVANLLKNFSSIPALVSTSKNVPIAQKLISEVSQQLGAGPASRPAVHPRPPMPGLHWDDLDVDTQIKYDAVVDTLTSDSPHVALDPSKLQQAAQSVRYGLLKLGELPQQPDSGKVQRHS